MQTSPHFPPKKFIYHRLMEKDCPHADPDSPCGHRLYAGCPRDFQIAQKAISSTKNRHVRRLPRSRSMHVSAIGPEFTLFGRRLRIKFVNLDRYAQANVGEARIGAREAVTSQTAAVRNAGTTATPNDSTRVSIATVTATTVVVAPQIGGPLPHVAAHIVKT